MAKNTTPLPPLLTRSQACKLLGLAPGSLRVMERDGRLPIERIGTGSKIRTAGLCEMYGHQLLADRAYLLDTLPKAGK